VRAPYLIGTRECIASELEKGFVYNNEFTCEKGEEYFINGEICFPGEKYTRNPKGGVRADSTYRTRFGPCVEHNGQIYENSNHNVSLAMRRLTRVRKADLKLHRRLQANQIIFFEEHEEIIDELRESYTNVMSQFSTHVSEAEEHHADPHAKKLLREQAWQELIETGEVTGDLWLRYVTYKMKKDEWAKPGKEPRMIGDLKVPASLLGFRVTKLLKKAMNQKPFEYRGGTIYFCATPSHKELKYVFESLLNPPGRFFFVYFSDDACLSMRMPDGSIMRGDVDISSCDGSHGPSVFEALTRLADGPARDALRCLVKQCEAPIRIYDLEDTGNRYVQLRPHGPRLYSGSTITTAINNLANIMIAVSIAEADITCRKDVLDAANKAGYIVTYDAAEIFEKVTFLKHSPVRDVNGEWQPVLNIGVLLRMSGVCKFDLPGRGDFTARAEAFQRALLHGAYPRSSFTLIENMKSAVSGEDTRCDAAANKAVAQLLAYKVDHTDDTQETHYFRSEDLYRRYELLPHEWIELEEIFGRAPTGTFYSSPVAETVLKTDYGLRCAYLGDR